MFFLKAVIAVLATAVTSLQFFRPAPNQFVSRGEQVLEVSWIPNAPIPDLPQYILGVCRDGGDQQCYAIHPVIESYSGGTEIQISNAFQADGFFKFCVFVPGVAITQAAALYQGPTFQVGN